MSSIKKLYIDRYGTPSEETVEEWIDDYFDVRNSGTSDTDTVDQANRIDTLESFVVRVVDELVQSGHLSLAALLRITSQEYLYDQIKLEEENDVEH